jgi:MoaA/NifB/PqqE/SkfB family radical SAM enzyme
MTSPTIGDHMMRSLFLRPTIRNTMKRLKRSFLPYRKARFIAGNKIRSCVFFITNACNAGCRHCFYANHLNQTDSVLGFERISGIIKKMPRLDYLILTGGEPFLRKEIAEICFLFSRQKVARNIQINTNGLLSGIINTTCRKILKCGSLHTLRLQLSIEGDGQTHDCIVGVKNASGRIHETLKRTSEIRKEYPNFEIFACVTLMSYNRNSCRRIFELLAPYNVEVKFAPFKDPSQDVHEAPEDMIFDYRIPDPNCRLEIEELKQVYHELIDLDCKYGGWCRDDQSRLATYIEMFQRNEKPFTCVAKHTIPVIFENGDVSLCEWCKPIGNLGDFNDDIGKLWNSPMANSKRSSLDQCWCTQGAYLLKEFEYGMKPFIDVDNPKFS